MMTNTTTLDAYRTLAGEGTAHGYVWFLTTMLASYNRAHGNEPDAPVRTQDEFDAHCQEQVANPECLQQLREQHQDNHAKVMAKIARMGKGAAA